MWDVPVRVVHVLLITCVAGAWLTREAQRIDLHAALGYCALFLVLFRVAWGFLGSRYARFASFAFSPRETWAYLASAFRGEPRHYTGHNPAGSWAVFGLLALVGASAATGVVVVGLLHGEGPVAPTSSFALADAWLLAHEYLAWAVLVLAAFHILGALWGSWLHRENLPAAMVTGKKAVHGDDAIDAPPRAAIAVGVAALTLAIALPYALVWSPHDVERRTREEQAAKAAMQSQPWVKECGSCHLAYAPAMLPIASWERTLEEQDRHFGEDLGIDEADSARLIAHAKASPPPSWGAWKLAASVSPGQAPLEISTTPFWRTAHASLDEGAFKPPAAAGRHECEACHRDAASGIFHPRMIQMAKGRIAP